MAISEQLKIEIKAQAKQAIIEMKKAEGAAGGIADGLKKAFAATAIIAGVKVVATQMKKMVLAAADLGESQNAVNVVFGESSRILNEFAEDAVQSVGLTTTAFNELATVVGAQLKQTGLDMDTVAQKTVELTQRAADTASIFNVDVKDAMEAYGAALRGEAEPARRFGVNLSDQAVQAEALASGLVSSKSEITDQIKVQARYNIIMQQSEGYAGDFANTQDSLSNQLKIARANVQELSASIGEDLIPAANAAVTAFNTLLTRMQEAQILKDAFQAQREGAETLDDKLLILQNRLERYTAMSRGQREETEREIAQIQRLIGIRDSNLARAEQERKEEAMAAAERMQQLEAEQKAEEERLRVIAAEKEKQAEAEASRIQYLSELRASANEDNLARQMNAVQAEIEASRAAAQAKIEADKAAHEAKIAQIQEEIAMYSNFAYSTQQIFANLINSMMQGDEELTAQQKRNILILFRMQQAASLAKIAMDTASAITEALPNIPLSIVVGALGATQMAAAMAAKPPVMLADGGIVMPTPGGTSAILGEAGKPEAVIPLDRLGGLGNITVNVYGTVGSQEDVATWVYEGIERAQQMGRIAA